MTTQQTITPEQTAFNLGRKAARAQINNDAATVRFFHDTLRKMRYMCNTADAKFAEGWKAEYTGN
jgi:hypothetical protein